MKAQTTFTWDGGQNSGTNQNYFTKGNNWTSNVAPVAGTTSNYTFAGTVDANGPIADGNTQWKTNTITFSSGASPFTVAQTGTGGFLLNTSIVNNDDDTQTISANIALGGTVTVSSSAAGSTALSGAISGGFGITKTGTNTLILSNATNSFTGQVSVQAGTLSFNQIANGAAASTLGTNSTIKLGATTTTGTLLYTGAAASVNRGLDLAGTTGGGTINTTGNSGALSLSGAVTSSGAGSKTLTLTGTSTAYNTLSGTISDNSLGVNTTSIVKSGSGTWLLTGTSTFTGQVHVQDGTLGVDDIGNAGSDSALGRNATIKLGSLTTTGTLGYFGAGNTSNRGLDLAGTTGGGTINATANSGALILSGAVTSSGAGSKTLTLTGTSTVANALNGVISDNSVSNTTSLTKSDIGTWTLGGAASNTYTGTTLVSGGTLTLAKTGTATAVAGPLTIGDGSGTDTVILGGGSTNQIADTSALTFAAGGVLNLNGNSETVGSIASASTNGSILLGAGTLTTGANNGSTAYGGSITTGAGGLTKTGSGTLTLTSTASNFTGQLHVANGTLTFNNIANSGANSAIGRNATIKLGDTTTTGTITYNGAAASVNRGIDLAGTTGGGTIDTTGNSGALVLSGAVTSSGAGSKTLTLTGTSTAANALNGVISDNSISNTTSLTKSGTGNWTLGGAASNTYTGATLVWGGTLSLAKTGSATAVAGSLTIGDGTGTDTVILGGGSTNQIADTSAVTFATGGVLNLNGNSETVGSIASASTNGNIILGAGTLTTGANDASTAYGGSITTGAGGLIKTGSGTLTLTSTASNFTGQVHVKNGTVTFNNIANSGSNSALGRNATIKLGDAGTTGAITYNGAAASVNRGIDLAGTTGGGTIDTTGNTGALTMNGTVTSSGAGSKTLTLTGTSTHANTLNGVISNNSGVNITSVAKTGTGNWTLNGTNTYTGTVSVAGGNLTIKNAAALGAGSAATTVSSGASLLLDQSAGMTVSKGALNLNGTGAALGSLVNVAGQNMWNGNITLNGSTTIYSATGGNLSLGSPSDILNNYGTHNNTPPIDTHSINLAGNTLTLAGNGGSIWVNGRLGGAGGAADSGSVTINNPGGTVYYNPWMNTYTGATNVTAGTLEIRTLDNQEPGNALQGGFYAINGALNIGGGASAAKVSLPAESGYLANEVLNFTTPVRVYTNGTLEVKSIQTINTLTLDGGTVSILKATTPFAYTGGLYLDATVTVTAGTAASTISGDGQLSLTRHFGGGGGTNVDRIFKVYDATGSSASDLNISAQIVAGGIVKQESGTLTISGTTINTYERMTTITDGTLNIQKNSALGGASGDEASGTRVNGGTLQMEGGVTVTRENLYLSGNGYNTGTVPSPVYQGALQNVSGTNDWAGLVTLETDGRITSTGTAVGDLLKLSGYSNGGAIPAATRAAVDTGGYTLNVYGAGSTTISGTVSGGGGIEKNEAGRLILSGQSTYTGLTEVKGGVVEAQHAYALGGAGATTVTAGSLNVSNSITLAEATINLNGSGVANDGALRSISGTNTLTGTVNIASATRINTDTSSTMTLSGATAISGSTSALLTMGGAGATIVSGNIVNTGGGGLTWDGTGSLSVSGLMGNSTNSLGTLTKSGSGGMTFSGVNISPTVHAGYVGNISLTSGTLTVGTGSSTTLNSTEFTSSASTVLSIAAGGKVAAVYDSSGNTVAGTVTGAGEFAATGNSGSVSPANALTGAFAPTLTFGANITGLGTLSVGGSIGGADFSGYFKLAFGSSVTVNVTTLNITGDTILDFGNATTNILQSVNLNIAPSARVYVMNWTSLTDAWYVTGNVGSMYGHTTNMFGNAPLNQITFQNYNGMTTTWVSGTLEGWLHNEIRPTPEPATYGAILVSGCLGLLGWRRYQRRKPTQG